MGGPKPQISLRVENYRPCTATTAPPAPYPGKRAAAQRKETAARPCPASERERQDKLYQVSRNRTSTMRA